MEPFFKVRSEVKTCSLSLMGVTIFVKSFRLRFDRFETDMNLISSIL